MGAGDEDERVPGRAGAAGGGLGPAERGGSLLDDVRGRIPVQGWPAEFTEGRDQRGGGWAAQHLPGYPVPGLGGPGVPVPGGALPGAPVPGGAGPGVPVPGGPVPGGSLPTPPVPGPRETADPAGPGGAGGPGGGSGRHEQRGADDLLMGPRDGGAGATGSLWRDGAQETAGPGGVPGPVESSSASAPAGATEPFSAGEPFSGAEPFSGGASSVAGSYSAGQAAAAGR